jgi:hypothetical protein
MAEKINTGSISRTVFAFILSLLSSIRGNQGIMPHSNSFLAMGADIAGLKQHGHQHKQAKSLSHGILLFEEVMVLSSSSMLKWP